MRNFFINMIFLFVVSHAIARMVNNATDLPAGGNTSVTEQLEDQVSVLAIRSRMKRYISQSDMLAVVDYHNQVRAQVFPPAANMEYMVCIVYDQVWDESLARSAESWAATCIWDHGPPYLLRYLGQNLSIRTGRYQSILQLVKPWYDEVKDYVFPYPQECNPTCPIRCYGPMCTHYTQMVWGETNRVGCAIQVCYNMVVWGYVWRQATYLVCDYSPKGNWVGEAPYKVGVPCSACPTNYGGSCRNNMCFPPANSNFIYWFKYSALIWTGLALLSMCYVLVLVSHLHTRSDAQARSDRSAGLH